MFTISPHFFHYLPIGIEILLYLMLAGMVLKHSGGQKSAAYLTAFYILLALSVHSADLAWQAALLPRLNAFMMEELHWYGALFLVLLLIFIFRIFLQKKNNNLWLGVSIFFISLPIFLALNIFRLPDVLWSNGTWMIPRERLGFGIASAAWFFVVGGAFFSFRRTYKETRQPLHRNRLLYWLPIFVFLFSADALLINNYPNWSAPFRLFGAWLLGYVVITHHLPDLQQIFRSAFVYISIALLLGLLFFLGYSFAEQLFPDSVTSNPRLAGTIISLFLALLIRPLFSLIENLADRWLHIDRQDVSKIVKEYSQSISNILDMERLANVTVSLIMEVMGIQRGFLFLVDKEKREEKSYFALRAIRNSGERPINAIWLDEDGPIAGYLRNEQHPLLQFDLDLLPRFKKSHPEEQSWLSQLNAEVYVPIFAKREWIGLFALGGKISGNRYSEEDLLTLSALAGQTAVALENARLVKNLIELNNKVRDAYRDLESTKRDLEKIDRTKSDFISIASHELRTPLTVMRGYTEMLLENPDLDQTILRMLKGIHEGTLRLHEIMDSLFDIAQIDARTLELELEPINVGALVKEVALGLSQAIKGRQQSLLLDLPPLPSIQADPNTLRKVFYHLISNAIKFTPNGGKISIHGKTLPFSNKNLPEGGIEIIVSDTGIGVDPNFKEVIFTKFYQPNEELNKHSTGKTKFKGSGAGLGLALSRGIVEAHGGKIWVESPGYDEENFPGSHFHVILPLRKQSKGNTLPISNEVQLTI